LPPSVFVIIFNICLYAINIFLLKFHWMLVCIILSGIISYVLYVKQPLRESYFKAKSVRFEAEICLYKFNIWWVVDFSTLQMPEVLTKGIHSVRLAIDTAICQKFLGVCIFIC
jgi:hypothetical protein